MTEPRTIGSAPAAELRPDSAMETRPPGSDTAPDAASIYVVDDDEGVRQSLLALLQASGLAAQAYASGADFLEHAQLHHPGCVLLDLRMEGLSGLQVFAALQQQNTLLKAVFLSAHGELASAVAAVKQGAVDWLEKPCDEPTLLDAVQRAIALSLALTERRRRQQWLQTRWSGLSPRQQEVARLLATGIGSKEVARALNQRDPERPIDPRTVDSHRSAIFLKLDIRSSHELGLWVEGLDATDMAKAAPVASTANAADTANGAADTL